jgi:Flp pilus assembly protein TadD
MRRLLAAAFVVLGAATGCSQATVLPRKAIALNDAGAVAFAAGHLEVAEARVALALEYNPRFVEAWVNLGLIDEARGNFELARQRFVKARDLNPDLPISHHALGQLDEREGHYPEAEHNYRAALKVDPGFAPSRMNLGRRLFERGAYDDAREQFLRLTQVAPAVPAGWTGLCESLMKVGREEEAEDVLVHVGPALEGDPNVVILRGRVLLLHKRYVEAVATLEPVTEAEDPPRASAAFAWMSLARLGMGDGERAQAEADRAVSLSPGDPLAQYAQRTVRKARADAAAASSVDLPQQPTRAGR